MRPLLLAAALLALTGCASVAPEALQRDVQQLAAGRAGVPTASPAETVEQLLAKTPLDADTAVRIALVNNPQLQASMAALAITDAERVQAATLPNPHFAFGRLREGSHVEIERALTFNVLQLATLPWRAKYAGQRVEIAKLEAAQQVIRTAADTRKAWVEAVAAQQTAQYMRNAKEAAEAGAELARRMARVGNWSKLQQAREQSTLADLTAQLARSEQAALAQREKLTRLMGLWGQQAGYALPPQLPELPKELAERTDIEAQALRERLDVRAARDETRFIAESQGLQRLTGVFDGLELALLRNTSFDNGDRTRETARGAEIEFPLPLFDWGQAASARSRASYQQSVARARDVAIRARSEAREAWHGWRTAYDVAKHYRDEIVPLRKFISDETVLRYNGMLASVWELLAETRNHVGAITNAIAAQRDFWIADTDLNLVLTGTSPGALGALQGSKAWTEENSSAGH